MLDVGNRLLLVTGEATAQQLAWVRRECREVARGWARTDGQTEEEWKVRRNRLMFVEPVDTAEELDGLVSLPEEIGMVELAIVGGLLEATVGETRRILFDQGTGPREAVTCAGRLATLKAKGEGK